MLRSVSVIGFIGLLTTVPDAHASPCATGFEVAPPATIAGTPRNLRATLASENGRCIFEVRLCANIGAACAPRPLRSLAGRGAAAGMSVPASLDAPGECGAPSEIVLVADGDRAVRRRLRATMRTANGRRHRMRLRLICAPATTTTPTSPTTTTTTSTPSTTTSTTLPLACESGSTRPCEGITGRTLGRRVDFPPSLPIASCGYGTSSNYQTPTAQVDVDAPAELHVIGVYEAARASMYSAASGGLLPPPPLASIDVVVHARPKPVVLVLAAYDSVRWNVTVEPGATLGRVIASGYEPQDVRGVPSTTVVEHLGPEDGFGYFYGWELASNSGGGQFPSGIEHIRARTGLIESTFQGCYGGVRFEVPHTDLLPRECTCDATTGDETMALRSVAFPGCEAITAESQYCLTSAGGSLALLGIDSGDVCPLASEPPLALSPIDATLAWRGQAAYACLYGGGLVRMSLTDGTVQHAEVNCGGVAVDDAGRLLVSMPSTGDFFWTRTLHAFDSWQDVLAGRSAGELAVTGFLERFTVRNGILYEAWHSTDTIDRTNLVSGMPLTPLVLDVYDGWILGLSVTGDGRLLIPGDTWGDTVWVFDSGTGVAEGIVKPTTPVTGLACVDRQ